MARRWCGAERADAGVVAVSATASPAKCVISVLLYLLKRRANLASDILGALLPGFLGGFMHRAGLHGA